MRYLPSLPIATVQTLTVICGVSWGLALVHSHHVEHSIVRQSIRLWPVTGSLAVLLLVCEGLRSLVLRRWRAVPAVTPRVCGALAALGIYVMYDEPFLRYRGDGTFLLGLALLSTFLLSIGPLVRSRAWLGVGGAALFSVTSLSMLIRNGFIGDSGVGFVRQWVT